MLRRLIMCFGVIHAVAMLSVTIWSSLQESIMLQGHLFNEPWFLATLTDTYLAFLLFYLWIFFTEKGALKKGVYLVLVLCLGNIAMGLMITYRAYRADHTLTWAEFFKGDLS